MVCKIDGKTGMPAPIGSLLILSGEIGSGKTTLLQNLISDLKSAGVQIQGLISPPVLAHEEKIGIDLVNLQTGEKRRFAEVNQNALTDLATTRWRFDSEVVKWGNQILSHVDLCQLLIVDEFGPLEFERGIGLTQGLKTVDQRNFQCALLVVRPGMLSRALDRWSDAEVFTMTRSTQMEMLASLRQRILDILHASGVSENHLPQ